ncbi:hypothetical protein [Methylobacterium sp. Leaf118]|uniref:hypothetical protein n=1 Tax=Methylobacterium sp. Leaf118 TaxID=2876562 RepID=UPI001E5F76D8|nr:hypothetical protein [Methylobacterium sp. Leaf118]
MSDEVLAAKRRQVVDQCRAVAHLARAIAKVHDHYEGIHRAGAFNLILNQVGERTSDLMDQLGDILNEMDACTPEDEWTHQVFEARERFDWRQV